MSLTAEQFDFITSSIGNYIEVGHGDELQAYFEPVIQAIDSGRYQRIAIKACHAVGKTFSFARIGDAIMGSYDETKLISTAPTYRQVHDLLWKEWATAHNNKLPELKRGRLNETELWINSETFARGFSPQRRVKSETGQGTDSVFQGYHGKFMTVIIFDEATDVDPQFWEQAEGLLNSGYRVLFICIGNPTSRNCKFHDCFKDRLWKTFSITCFDSPNLKANGIHTVEDIQKEADYVQTLPDYEAIERLMSYSAPVPYLINTRWVIEKAIEWGVDHPLFMGKVLGEFPNADGDNLVSEAEIETSWSREAGDIEKETEGFIGLDVARFGIDKSALSSMIGNDQIARLSMSKNDTNQVVGKTINFIEEHQENYPQIREWVVAVDGGFGHGVIDRLRELQESEEDERVHKILKPVEILEINFGSSDWVMFHYGWVDEFTRRKRMDDRKVQEDRENYANFKAKMFDLLARDIKKSIRLLKDDVYLKQLPTIKKDVDSKGRLKIESKEDYKKRTGETSPDDSDSLALCNFGRYFARSFSSMSLFVGKN
ncbi:hypothetical protein KKI24_27740 [bacterium]|nr:hypothetical protein [bacterium]